MNDNSTIYLDEDGARVDGSMLGDHQIPPVRIDQSLTLLAKITALTIGSFAAGIEDPGKRRALTSFCLALFAYEMIGHASDQRQAAAMFISAADEKLAALGKEPEETPPDDEA